MGERTEHAPGTFSWVDLTTPDPDAAKSFYTELFGWTAEDFPLGDSTNYSIVRIDGKDVGAISPQRQEQRDAGMPAAWNSYITVASADAAAERAAQLGGAVHASPFEAMSAGRMAVIQDPQGAFFSVWQPRDHNGAQLVNATGALVWNELGVSDVDASAAFYGALFDWTFSPMEGSPARYLVITNGSRTNGGITELAAPHPSWTPYFAVDSLDASLATLVEFGGSSITGVVDIGIAKLAVVQDPQGATFALYDGQLDD
jgi:predicted enzyme related to lactoylglutathione lyase